MCGVMREIEKCGFYFCKKSEECTFVYSFHFNVLNISVLLDVYVVLRNLQNRLRAMHQRKVPNYMSHRKIET